MTTFSKNVKIYEQIHEFILVNESRPKYKKNGKLTILTLYNKKIKLISNSQIIDQFCNRD